MLMGNRVLGYSSQIYGESTAATEHSAVTTADFPPLSWEEAMTELLSASLAVWEPCAQKVEASACSGSGASLRQVRVTFCCLPFVEMNASQPEREGGTHCVKSAPYWGNKYQNWPWKGSAAWKWHLATPRQKWVSIWWCVVQAIWTLEMGFDANNRKVASPEPQRQLSSAHS